MLTQYSLRWFYAACLLDLFGMNETLKFLYVAVIRNSNRLFLTLVLTILALYLFSVVTYLYFKGMDVVSTSSVLAQY